MPRSLKNETIYMPLLNEGVEVWRPVAAEPLGGSTYRVTGTVPTGEQWAFPANSKVICETRTLSDGPVLAAVRLAD